MAKEKKVKVPELLEIYDLEGELIRVEERSKFYKKIKKEFAETGKITEMVQGIRLFLLNSNGRIYLQRRSRKKKENAGLYDKTIGGHVAAGTDYDTTLVKECSEELGFPSAILPVHAFPGAVKAIDLKIVALFKQVDYMAPFMSVRISEDGSKIIQPWMSSFYVGYYDGPIRFADGESCGIMAYSLDELKEEIKETPKTFTEDLKFMLDKYEHLLVPIDK